LFFSKMLACGFSKFMLNNDDNVVNASFFGYTELSKETDDLLELKKKIEREQPAPATLLPETTHRHKKTKSKEKPSEWWLIIAVVFFVIHLARSCSPDLDVEQEKTSYKDKYEYSMNDYDIADMVLEKYKAETPEVGNRKVCIYISEVPYAKGDFENNIYRSEFLKLQAKLPEGYSWMNSDELNALLSSETYQIDWEFGAQGTDPNEKEAVFSIPIGAGFVFEEDYLNIIKEINAGFNQESLDGKRQFANSEAAEGEEVLPNQYREYNHVFFTDEANMRRDYYFNQVDGRLVCIMVQRSSYENGEDVIEISEI